MATERFERMQKVYNERGYDEAIKLIPTSTPIPEIIQGTNVYNDNSNVNTTNLIMGAVIIFLILFVFYKNKSKGIINLTKVKIQKLFLALYIIIAMAYSTLHIPVNDTVIETSFKGVSNKYITTSGHIPINYVGMAGGKNYQSGHVVDYQQLFLELFLIGLAVFALYLIVSILKKGESDAS